METLKFKGPHPHENGFLSASPIFGSPDQPNNFKNSHYRFRWKLFYELEKFSFHAAPDIFFWVTWPSKVLPKVLQKKKKSIFVINFEIGLGFSNQKVIGFRFQLGKISTFRMLRNRTGLGCCENLSNVAL